MSAEGPRTSSSVGLALGGEVETIWDFQLWIPWLGYLLTGVLAGVLAGLLGVGGGIVIVPALIGIFGFQGMTGDWIPQVAVGSSLASIVGTSIASIRAHQRRAAVRWELFRRLVPGLLIGAGLGALVAGHLPGLWLKRIFTLFVFYVAWQMLRARATEAHYPLPGLGGMSLVGTLIGGLSALVGIGGGTLTVPFLIGGGTDPRQAVATSSACGLPIAVAGGIGFAAVGWGVAELPAASTGYLYWPAVGAVLLGSIPTAPFGARLAHSLPTATLKRVFAILLLAVGLKLWLW